MRSPAEIVARIHEVAPIDWMGTQRLDLLAALPWEFGKEFANEGITEADWNKATESVPKDPKELVLDYLPFAWDKANYCRGLSAGRSLEHMQARLWLMGHDIEIDDYQYYGKGHLAVISEFVGFPWKDHDNGEWVNDEGADSISPAQIEEYVAQIRAQLGLEALID